MLDTGTAKRPTGETVYSSATQAQVPAYASGFEFSSRCKIQSGGLQARAEEVGGRTATTVALELHLPVATVPLTDGDEWTVTVPHPMSTVPVGTVYEVVAPMEGSMKTARRYQIKRVAS
jgi:hypothetical protein